MLRRSDDEHLRSFFFDSLKVKQVELPDLDKIKIFDKDAEAGKAVPETPKPPPSPPKENSKEGMLAVVYFGDEGVRLEEGWRMEDGGWRMEDGGWRMEDGF